MALDRVRVLKIEKPATGGTETDVYPTDIRPSEDAVDARGYVLQNDTSDDQTVVISRDASDNMTFADGVVSGTKTLANLAEGGDVSAAANMTDETLVRGDGGVKGVQDTAITVDDTDHVKGVKTLGYTSVYDIGTITGTTMTITLSNGQNQKVTLGNAAIALTIVDTGNVADGTWRIKCTQHTGGSFGITSESVSGGTILTPDGTALEFSTAADSKDILMIVKEGTEYTLAFGAKNLIVRT